MLEAEDKSIQVVTETIAGVHVIKAFATEKQEIEKYHNALSDFLTRALNRIRLFANFQPIIRSIASASHLSLFLLAGIIIILQDGKGMHVGDLMILGQAMGAILSRLQQVATINEQYQNAIVSSRRLWEVLTAPPTVPERPDPIPLPKGAIGEVKFEHVSFGYGKATLPGETATGLKPVLHDITFTVPGGSIVAIVGPTGAGKSSLVNLMARFYDPWEGRVTIDGVDLRDLSLATLRSQVSLVFQETYLFSDTVSANIAYGRPGISQARSNRPRGWRRRTSSSKTSRKATTRSSASAAPTLAAASGSGWRSRGRSSPTRACWCSTTPRPPSTRRPKTSFAAACG